MQTNPESENDFLWKNKSRTTTLIEKTTITTTKSSQNVKNKRNKKIECV